LAEFADSFESVWHARTRLYEEVLGLRDRLKQEEKIVSELRAESERAAADRAALLTELERARASLEGRSPVLPMPPQTGSVESFLQDRDRLLDEVTRRDVDTPEERQKLLEFLLDALKRVEQVPSDGQDAVTEPAESGKTLPPPR
jgi:hypothetical protein